MNESRTVVATTTRTRPSRDSGIVDTQAFRLTPAGLADGLGLGSVLRRRRADAPQKAWVPRVLRVAQDLGNFYYISVLSCRGGSCGRADPCALSAPCSSWRHGAPASVCGHR